MPPALRRNDFILNGAAQELGVETWADWRRLSRRRACFPRKPMV
jgi:hypothetical protein